MNDEPLTKIKAFADRNNSVLGIIASLSAVLAVIIGWIQSEPSFFFQAFGSHEPPCSLASLVESPI